MLVGSLDAVTHTGDAVREIVKFVTRESDKPVYRQRMSNNFGPDGRLLEYSFNRALGTYIIWVLESEKRENLNLGVAIEEGVGFIAKFGAMITGGATAARPRGAAAEQRKTLVAAQQPSWRRASTLDDLPRVDEEEEDEDEDGASSSSQPIQSLVQAPLEAQGGGGAAAGRIIANFQLPFTSIAKCCSLSAFLPAAYCLLPTACFYRVAASLCAKAREPFRNDETAKEPRSQGSIASCFLYQHTIGERTCNGQRHALIT